MSFSSDCLQDGVSVVALDFLRELDDKFHNKITFRLVLNWDQICECILNEDSGFTTGHTFVRDHHGGLGGHLRVGRHSKSSAV